MADDASMERAMDSAIENTVAAAGDARAIWLAPLPHLGRIFQDRQPPAAQRPGDDAHDDDGDGDDVDGQLDEISPAVSDLDEQMIERPALLALAIARAAGASLEEAAVLAALLMPYGLSLFEGDEYNNGGFGAVPAAAAAVAELKKGTFRAGGDGDGAAKGCCGAGGVTGCAICLEEFEDGEEVTVMPCERGHGFHPDCITEWLGCSNMCPLCRHPLPTGCGDDR